MLHDLGSAAAGPLDDRIELRLGHELRDGNSAHRRVGNQWHHCITVTAEHHRLNIADGDVERFGKEGAITRRVQNPRHAEHALAGKSGDLHCDVRHHIERVRDDNQNRVRRSRPDLLGNLLDDSGVGVEEIVARHPRLAGYACRNHHDVGVARLLVAIGTDDA